MCDIKNHSNNCKCYYCCKFIELHQNKLCFANKVPFIQKENEQEIEIENQNENNDNDFENQSFSHVSENSLVNKYFNQTISHNFNEQHNTTNSGIKSNMSMHNNIPTSLNYTPVCTCNYNLSSNQNETLNNYQKSLIPTNNNIYNYLNDF